MSWKQIGSDFSTESTLWRAPQKRPEAYRYINLKDLESLDWSIDPQANPRPLSSSVRAKASILELNLLAPQSCEQEGLSVRVLSRKSSAPADFLEWYKNLEALSLEAKISADLFEEQNQKNWEQAVFIRVADGARFSGPIVFLSEASSGLTVPRVWISVGKGAEVSFINSFFGAGTGPHIPVLELVAEEGSKIECLQANSASSESVKVGRERFFLKSDVTFNSLSLSMGARLIRENFDIYLAGTSITASLNGLALGSQRDVIDDHTSVNHLVGGSTTEQLYKSILAGSAKYVFNGQVVIANDAQKANSQQLNQNLLLSAEAEVNSKPQLEIAADDVKATHGATVGQLNQEEVFYFMSRGISKAQAEQMLRRGYGEEMILKLEQSELRAFARATLELADGRLQ